MSTVVETAPTSAPPSRPTWLGVSTVAELELRQRIRSTRWIVVLVIWFVVLAVLTTLIRVASSFAQSDYGITYTAAEQAVRDDSVGTLMFAVVVSLVLGLGMLVSPAISATSVNGDRANGVLATLQTTLLTPLEIALGKLLASWATSLALLVTALPFILWGFFTGGTSVGRLLVVLAVLVLALLVVCTIGLGWSAVTARTTSSAVLTYLTVVFLAIGFPLLFALASPLVYSEDTIPVRSDQGTADADGNWIPKCVDETTTTSRVHTERIWWLLAPSPFVVLADASPAPRPKDVGIVNFDPLTEVRQAVRGARLGPADSENWCTQDQASYDAQQREDIERQNALPAIWPYGLAVNLLFAGGAFAATVRRLRTPSRKLPRGTRVA